jgi:hypothetical protein
MLSKLEVEIVEGHAGDPAWLLLQASVFKTWIRPDIWATPYEGIPVRTARHQSAR